MSPKEEDVCLNWSDHSISFFSKAQAFYNNNIMTDVTLTCGKTSFAAHKLILSICSDYFSNLFALGKIHPNPAAQQQIIVYLKDVDPKHMELILEFMYNGSITCNESDLQGVLDTAHGLEIRGLTTDKEDHSGNLPSWKGNDRKKICRKAKRPDHDQGIHQVQRKREHQEEEIVESTSNSDLIEDLEQGNAGPSPKVAKNVKEEEEVAEEESHLNYDMEEYDESEVNVIPTDFEDSLLAPNQCPVCMRHFFDKGTMKRHYKTRHCNEKPFECWVCGHRTTQKAGLGSHCNLVHGMSMAEFKERAQEFDIKIKLARSLHNINS